MVIDIVAAAAAAASGTAAAGAHGDPSWPGSCGDPGVYAEAVVDLEAIAHNTAVLARHASTAVLMAVVKADGFGHGAVEVARTALAHGAGWLGVTSTAEALDLRGAGIGAPILSWMHLPAENVGAALRARIDLAVPTVAHLVGVAECARTTGTRAAVHLKIDTGLHRNGAPPADWAALVEAARAFERDGLLRVRGVWSHLVHADDPAHPTTDLQVRRFEAAVGAARDAGLRPDLLHLANSGAGLTAPRTRFDMVRAGIGLYGVEPVPARHFGLRPAMTLLGRALTTRRVARGEGVSYGHVYTARRETGLLLLPLGFADGLPRAAGPRAQVWAAGRRRRVAGRIAMDQCVIEVGDTPVAAGDEVVVFGTGAGGEPTVTEWADWAGTIPHEILTGIGARVPRRYLPAAPPPGRDPRPDPPGGSQSAARSHDRD